LSDCFALQALPLPVFQIQAHTTAARTTAAITHTRAATAAAGKTMTMTRMTMGGMGASGIHGAAMAGDLRPTATDEQRMYTFVHECFDLVCDDFLFVISVPMGVDFIIIVVISVMCKFEFSMHNYSVLSKHGFPCLHASIGFFMLRKHIYRSF
jgi:hypothetical protein